MLVQYGINYLVTDIFTVLMGKRSLQDEQEHQISWRTRIALFSLHLCHVCVFPFIAKSECEEYMVATKSECVAKTWTSSH